MIDFISRTAEFKMREVRKFLKLAEEAEWSHDIELADAAGAIAANKLAQAIRLSSAVVGIK
jgi:ubiquinone biosynthesis protein UbiJ